MGLALQTEIGVCVWHPDVNSGSLYSSANSSHCLKQRTLRDGEDSKEEAAGSKEKSEIPQLQVGVIKS